MPLSRRLAREPRSYWAMLVAHAGVGVFVVGVTMVNGFDDHRDVHMRPGDSAELGGHRFSFVALDEISGPNYMAARARFEISRDGEAVTVLHPEKRVYMAQRMPMTEAGIDRGFTRDLYVSLGESTGDGAWVVRLQHKPFVGWIWGGCLIMAFGGLLAASDRRYRIGARAAVPEAAPVAMAANG